MMVGGGVAGGTSSVDAGAGGGAGGPSARDAGEAPGDAGSLSPVLFGLVATLETPRGEPESNAVLDMNSDGRADVLLAANDIFYLARNTPTGFVLGPTWTTDPASPVKGFGLFDLNRDGRFDVFLARPNETATATGDFALNGGDERLTFSNVGNEAKLRQRTVLFDDFDSDGNVDAFHLGSAFDTNHGWNELHRGIAGGRFEVSNSIDTAMPFPFWHQRVSIPGTPCDGEEWSNQQSKGGVVRDFDGDGKPDVIWMAYTDLGFADPRCTMQHQQFTYMQGYRGVFLLRNTSTPGRMAFEDVSKAALGANAYCNSPAAKCDEYYAPLPIDFDQDGDLDLVLGGLYNRSSAPTAALMRLFRNDSTPGVIRFVDVTARSPTVQALNEMSEVEKDKYRFSEGAPLDLENDGFVDFAFTNRNDSAREQGVGFVHVFHNQRDGTFKLIERTTSGIPFYANSITSWDFDADGALDLVVNDKFFTGKTYIYRSLRGRGHWLKLDVKVQGTPAFAMGTAVFVYGPDGGLLGRRDVRTDVSYRSKREPRIDIGLGEVTRVDVKVVSANGRAQWFRGLTADTLHVLEVSTGP